MALQNPYAHMDELDELWMQQGVEWRKASAGVVATSAAVKVQGHADDYLPESGNKAKALKSRGEIAQTVSDLHRRLWNDRANIWFEGVPKNPILLLDPSKAAQLLGWELVTVTSLGTYESERGRVAVAGTMDREQSVIQISSALPAVVQRFTGAHEIGHVLLHPSMTVLHRDRALDGTANGRERIEVEADVFAVLFLMPEKLIRAEFEARFLTQHFELNESTEYALGRKTRARLTAAEISRVLASAVHYNGKYFRSLSDCFGLSVESVAIRLEELKLCAGAN